MTRPRGELTTHRVRGGHTTDWANPTRWAQYMKVGKIGQPGSLNADLAASSFSDLLYHIIHLKYNQKYIFLNNVAL